MVEAAARGLHLLRPYGDSARFDFVVTRGARFRRVQVRATSVLSNGSYQCNCASGKARRPYSSRQIDFLAVYIVPCDTWYIIPARVLGRRISISFSPHKPNSRCRYEKFREAWDLLAE